MPSHAIGAPAGRDITEKRTTRGPLAVLAAAAFALAAGGCEAGFGTGYGTTAVTVGYGTPAYYTDVVPYDIEAYPHYYYNGANAYLVGGDWYYPTARGWTILRQEPQELARYRTRIVTSPGYVTQTPRYYSPAPGYRPAQRYYSPAPAYVPQQRYSSPTTVYRAPQRYTAPQRYAPAQRYPSAQPREINRQRD